MPKKVRNNISEQAANFNWAIIDLFNLPDKISFQIKKLSSITNTVDCRNEDFKSFLQSNGYINHDYILIRRLNRPIFACKIGKFDKFYYAFDLCSAIREALDTYETNEKLKCQQQKLSKQMI